MMNQLFIDRVKQYFNSDYEKYLNLLNDHNIQGFFLNQKKADRDEIFKLIDFDYQETKYSLESFYYQSSSIGKSIAYELGLIYPQEIASSLTSKFINKDSVKIVVDMCAAPGGKTINILNRLDDDVICISNDINHKRSELLSQNLERLGLSNVIITNKDCNVLASQLEGVADIVIVDAPCSGEGIIRKYPEILDDYNLENINNLSKIQADLLQNAYRMLSKNGQLIYSTCTYAFEEDEQQITSFLNNHHDMSIVDIEIDSYSTLKGAVKLSPLNGTEGQFFCMMLKNSDTAKTKIKMLKTVKEKVVDEFIERNFTLDKYYLYKYNNHYYLSLSELLDLGNNILKYGIYAGDIINNRFEPNHNLFRANILKNKYRYVYDMNDDEYLRYIHGDTISAKIDNNYYLMTYHNHSIGYGKCVSGIIKNKYPKGLRRMV